MEMCEILTNIFNDTHTFFFIEYLPKIIQKTYLNHTIDQKNNKRNIFRFDNASSYCCFHQKEMG